MEELKRREASEEDLGLRVWGLAFRILRRSVWDLGFTIFGFRLKG